jgi:hypothetical protein
MTGYEKQIVGRQYDLERFLGRNLHLRSRIGFSTSDLPEDLHYEESYEFLIPQDKPLTVKIFPEHGSQSAKGSEVDDLQLFEEVTASPGEILVIFPEFCHLVIKKGRFIALKPEGKFKRLAKGEGRVGRCEFSDCTLWNFCEHIGRHPSLPTEKLNAAGGG